jgi:hypothetical protein
MKENTYGSRTLYRVGKVKLSIIMALVVILPIGALMIAVLRSEYSATTVQAQLQQEQSSALQDNISSLGIEGKITLSQAELLIDLVGLRDLLDEYGIGIEQYQALYNDTVQMASEYSNQVTQHDNLQSRFAWGSQGYGWYDAKDQTGITILMQEINMWAAVTGVLAAVIIVTGVIAFLGLLPSLGLTAAVWLKLTALLGGLGIWIWVGGPGNEAIRVLDVCKRKSESGQRYGFSRHYAFGITTGYSAW